MTRLRFRADINPETAGFNALPDDAEIAFLPLEAVWPDARLDTSRRRLKSSVTSGYTRFQSGDVIVPKITPTFQAGRANVVPKIPHGIAAGTTELHIVRPTGVDVRYLHYLMHTAPFLQGGESEMTGVAGQKRVPDRWLKDTPVPVDNSAEQHRIADFLDRETERIDALVDKKRRLVDALRERLTGVVELQIRAMVEKHEEVPLKFAVPEVTVGIVVTPARWYASQGVPAIRGTNVRPGRIDTTDLVHISADGHALHQKSALRAGDLVVVRTGKAGAAAVVPKELDGANCIDVLLIRRSGSLIPRYLEYVINSDWTRKHIASNSVGTIQSHFNVASLRELPIPVPSLPAQEAAIKRLDTEADLVERLDGALSRQISLLAEYREALITAAVIGEIDVDEFDADRQMARTS